MSSRLGRHLATVLLLAAGIIALLAVDVLLPEVQATAIISLSPTSGPPGTTVTLTGSINTPGGNFTVIFDSTSVRFGISAVTGIPSGAYYRGGYGAVTTTFTVPSSASPGIHTVTLTDATDHSTYPLQFTVISEHPFTTTTRFITTTSLRTETSVTSIRVTPEPYSVVMGAIAGSLVVATVMVVYVLGRNSLIRGLEETVRRYEEPARSLQTRPESQSKNQPRFDSINVQVRTGIQRLENKD